MKRIAWQELRDIAILVGFVYDRTKGDHYIMTKPGAARPVVIKMAKELGEDIVRTNMQTMGLSRKEFDQHLNTVRRRRR